MIKIFFTGTVIFKLNSKNCSRCVNRETRTNQVVSNHSKLFKYTHCAYSKPSYLYGRSILVPEDETH